MINKIYSSFILAIFSLFLLFSCGNKNQDSVNETSEITEITDTDIIITKEQFETSGMKLGSTVVHTFENNVSVSGFISVSPQGKAKINTPIAGIIRSNPLSIGQYVKAGQLLFTVESNEIIQIQQEYAESISLLSALESEYNRQKKLYNEKITSEKDFQSTESNYKSLKAKCSGLQARLRLLNINPAKTEEGNIVSKIGIYAPINGYITMQNVVLGQYAEPQSGLMELIDINKFYLKLFLFEKDIHYLKIGQAIQFYTSGKNDVKYKAELMTIGKSVNPESKTIECIAKLDRKDIKSFVNNTYIEAIITTESKQSKALPNSAVVKSGDDYFILIKTEEHKDGYKFRKTKVNIGTKSADFIEILSDTEIKDILIEGAYNIIIE